MTGCVCSKTRMGGVASYLVAIAALFLAFGPALAGAPHIRPFWGDEAMWGYWEFEADYLPKTKWKIVSVSQEAAGTNLSANLIDDRPETYYYPNGKDAYEVVIDLGASCDLGAFTVLTMGRPNGAHDSMMKDYEFYVSDSPDNRGQAAAKGAFEGDVGHETVVTFPPAKGRYVTLKATARPNANKELCIRELSLVPAEAVKRHEARKKAEAEEKTARWRDRDSAAAVEALAKELTGLLYTTPQDINQSNLRNRPGLEAVSKLNAAGKPAEALASFRDYYLDKLRRPQAFGLHANDVHPYGRGYAGVSDFPGPALERHLDAEGLAKLLAVADDMMKGDMQVGNVTVHIGEPGSVDWMAPGPPYGHTTKHRQQAGPYRELWWGGAFQPLFAAYMATKKEAYLKRWVDYMDDWSLNESFLAEIHPVYNHDNSAYPTVTTVRMLAGIAASMPWDNAAVPAPAFARIMRKLVLDTPLNDIVYMRGNPNAWSPGAGRMLFAMMIDEFKVAPTYFRETRRRNIEDINVTQNLRDGTEDHQWPGYNFLLMRNVGALQLMDAREGLPSWAQPVWERELHTPLWQRELMDHLVRRGRYYFHWATPAGEYPLVTHQEPPTEKRGKLREALAMLPEILNDPVTAQLVSTLYGDGSLGRPGYTDEWYPYGGYSIARAGWGRQEVYGSMFCSPQPGCGSVGSGCKNNAFGLGAYGLDMLSEDVVHSYIRATSPIQVDKKRQCFDFNVPKSNWPSAHRGEMVSAWNDPSPWRWHTSQRFGLMEGVYAGVYANNTRDRKDFLDDVTHQRLAMFVREAGLWIITDRLRSAKGHDYEQLWWLPLKKKDYAGFRPEDIVVDEAARTIKTRRTSTDKWWSWDTLSNTVVRNANLSMYLFTQAATKLDSKTQKSDGEMYDYQRVGVTWQGQGDQQIVTAVFPRKPTDEPAKVEGAKPDAAGAGVIKPDGTKADGTENDLKSIKPLKAAAGIDGFEAVTPEGATVTYLAAQAADGAELSAGDIQAKAEALLVVRPAAAGHPVAGLVLGCKALTAGGKGVAGPAGAATDFEFVLPASADAADATAAATTTPIYRPIGPVTILPEANVLADPIEVSLTSATPGVVMTYTLDGSEPTPRSTPYKAPFALDRNAVVKARAYRAGVTENPPQTSGTHATPTSLAVFTKAIPCPAEEVKNLQSGLECEYFEDFWKDMWLFLDKLQPKKKAPVADLFDMSQIPADNAPVGAGLAPRVRPYAFRYTGYLNVPADGVYTLHAPREFVRCDTIAGYELQVWLGHVMRLDAGVVRRENDLNYWYPATRLHAFGTWSVALKKGYQPIRLVYIDFRTDSAKRLNRGGTVRDLVWPSEKPALEISGPGMKKQAIPAAWLWR
jgi:hypothetical protein